MLGSLRDTAAAVSLGSHRGVQLIWYSESSSTAVETSKQIVMKGNGKAKRIGHNRPPNRGRSEWGVDCGFDCGRESVSQSEEKRARIGPL